MNERERDLPSGLETLDASRVQGAEDRHRAREVVDRDQVLEQSNKVAQQRRSSIGVGRVEQATHDPVADSIEPLWIMAREAQHRNQKRMNKITPTKREGPTNAKSGNEEAPVKYDDRQRESENENIRHDRDAKDLPNYPLPSSIYCLIIIYRTSCFNQRTVLMIDRGLEASFCHWHPSKSDALIAWKSLLSIIVKCSACATSRSM